MKKFIIFFAIIICGLYAYDANAQHLICPEGCFCLNDGYNSQTGYSSESAINVSGNLLYDNYCKTPITTPQGSFNKQYGNVRISSDCNNNNNVTYCLNQFSEFYEGYMGFYGFINNTFVYGYTQSYIDLLQCPYTYPNSNRGAKSVFECYRVMANGQKEYYTVSTNTQTNYSGNYAPNNINVLLQNLQSALNQANTAAQNLQNALNSANQGNNTVNTVAPKTSTTSQQNNVTNTNLKSTQSSDNTTVNTTSSTANNKTITTQSTTEKTPSVTTIANKTDFSSLSSIFNTDKAAVHKQTAGRVAIPKKIQRKAITNTTGQQRRMATKHQNARFGNSKKPTLTR